MYVDTFKELLIKKLSILFFIPEYTLFHFKIETYQRIKVIISHVIIVK